MTPFLQDRALLRDRLRAGLDCFAAQPGVDSAQIAIMGYCFGGLCALDLARSGAPLKGAVSIHGLFGPPGLPPQPIRARVLALHGYADPMVPPEQVVAFGKEMSDAKVDWQLHGLGGVLHAYHRPRGQRSQARRAVRCARRASRVAGDAGFLRRDLRLATVPSFPPAAPGS